MQTDKEKILELVMAQPDEASYEKIMKELELLVPKRKTMTFLYQYHRNLDYLLDTITNKRLYFSSPSDFNDPFDCRPKFSLFSCKNDPEEIWRRYFFFLAKYQYSGISDEESKKHADAAILNGKHKDKDWLCEADKHIKNDLSKAFLLISCFSKSPRNAMMWAHYADNHKGAVLQFKKANMVDGEALYKGFDVEYFDKPIPLERYVKAMEETESGDEIAFSRLIFCTKSAEWQSEKEVRFFSRDKYITYPEEMLTGIIFGSECSVHWRDHIYTALSEWSIKPAFFQEDSSISSTKICFRRLS